MTYLYGLQQLIATATFAAELEKGRFTDGFASYWEKRWTRQCRRWRRGSCVEVISGNPQKPVNRGMAGCCCGGGGGASTVFGASSTSIAGAGEGDGEGAPGRRVVGAISVASSPCEIEY